MRPVNLKIYTYCVLALSSCLTFCDSFGQDGPPYNVLFIAIDDLNDWTGFLGGHPDALTPYMDHLAQTGMVFTNAHAAAPACNPSRLSIMTGFHPFSSGLYRNPRASASQDLRVSPVTQTSLTLPEYLNKYDYYTLSRGKIYHTADHHPETWEYWESLSGSYGEPSTNEIYRNHLQWGPTDVKVEETPDIQTAKWAAEQLLKDHDRPFFLACGFYRPHLPWYVPRMFYDRFELDSIDTPIINPDDLNDVGVSPSDDYLAISGDGKIREATRAYLANINYADSCIGVVMNALRKSPYVNNTIVILWGDHGWHLGEKLHYKKFTLWEEATRTPLIIRVPGITDKGLKTNEPVSLLDLYPTITSICGVPPNTNNQGTDLTPLLLDPNSRLDDFTVSTYKANNHSIRTRDWRFISRSNGNKELYNHNSDSLEHINLWLDPSYSSMIDSFQFALDSFLLLDNPKIENPIRSHKIPGTIQAENYDRGGNNISYYDLDSANVGLQEIEYDQPIYYRNSDWVDISPSKDTGGGFHISHIRSGEWLKYTIKNIDRGVYKIHFRIASENDTGVIKIFLDDKLISSTPIVNTGCYSEWRTLTSDSLVLESSQNSKLRMEFHGSGFIINEFTFSHSKENTLLTPLRERTQSLKVLPNPTSGLIKIDFGHCFSGEIELVTISGQSILKKMLVNKNFITLHLPDKPSGLYILKAESSDGLRQNSKILKN